MQKNKKKKTLERVDRVISGHRSLHFATSACRSIDRYAKQWPASNIDEGGEDQQRCCRWRRIVKLAAIITNVLRSVLTQHHYQLVDATVLWPAAVI